MCGKQNYLRECTIVWHVDDLKISHQDRTVVDHVINLLELEFGKEAPLTKTRGKIHDYLGMVLDYSKPGMIEIGMKDYVMEIISEAQGDMSGTAPTPAGNHLFSVNTTSALYLNKSDAQQFHHIMAKLLFLCKRSRPDLQTAVALLTTRVKGPDQDDYNKLSQVIKYLRGAPDISLKLCAHRTDKISWWVDASFATHHDMRSHTGGIMMLGSGAVYST